MSAAAPRRLEPVLQHYAWGSQTAIARIRGTEPSGEPEAELWFGAHPKAPARVDGTSLDVMIDSDPALLGDASVAAFGPRLPYLLKILAAEQPLSLQAHPSREQAETGYAREESAGIARDAPERNYKDDWPKPEMLVALEPTEALCGFRDPAATARLLDQLHVAGLQELIGPLRQADPVRAVRDTFLGFLSLDHDQLALVEQVVTVAARVRADATGADDLAALCRTAVELNAHCPGDPGVLGGLLMNRVRLAPGHGVFLPAGNLHAYLSGVGVEIMANSDNVLRGGLTPKHVDVAELAAIVDFSPGFPGVVEPVDDGSGALRYPTPAPEFALWRLVPGRVPVPAPESARIVLAIGAATLSGAGVELSLTGGEAAIVPAHVSAAVTGDGPVFVAAPGL